jgi:hypothetical protein
VIRPFLLAAAVLLFTACASAPKPQPFNRQAHADIKHIAVMSWHESELQLNMLNHPGTNFGLIGGLIAIGDLGAKQDKLQALAKAASFDHVTFFQTELDRALRERGYTVSWSNPLIREFDRNERGEARRVAASVERYPDAQAHLEINLGVVGYVAAGAGDSEPYRPTVAVGVRLLSADGEQVLFRDSVLYHNVFDNRTAIVLEPRPEYAYPDFDALEAAGQRPVEGLGKALVAVADAIAEQL